MSRWQPKVGEKILAYWNDGDWRLATIEGIEKEQHPEGTWYRVQFCWPYLRDTFYRRLDNICRRPIPPAGFKLQDNAQTGRLELTPDLEQLR